MRSVLDPFQFLIMSSPSALRTSSRQLLPRRVDGFADQICRVRSRARTKLLETSGIHLRDVEVSFLVRAHSVHAPKRAWEIAHGSPCVQETAVKVVLQHLVGITIERHQRTIRADLDKVEARRTDADFP